MEMTLRYARVICSMQGTDTRQLQLASNCNIDSSKAKCAEGAIINICGHLNCVISFDRLESDEDK